MHTYFVTLKDGTDWRIKAPDSRTAIKRVRVGKGRLVGRYFTTIARDRAERS